MSLTNTISSISQSVLISLIAIFIVHIIIFISKRWDLTYRIINFFSNCKKIVFVFEDHKTNKLKWKEYWKIFRDDGYKIIRIKKYDSDENWIIINKHIKRADDITIAGYAKMEYAFYIGWMGSKKKTSVYYQTKNSIITKMTFTNDEFKSPKLPKHLDDVIICQNKKSSRNLNLKNSIDMTTEDEYPISLEYIFELRKVAEKISKKHRIIKINIIGKAVFAFVFAQLFAYDSHKIIVKNYNNKNKTYDEIDLMEKTEIT